MIVKDAAITKKSLISFSEGCFPLSDAPNENKLIKSELAPTVLPKTPRDVTAWDNDSTIVSKMRLCFRDFWKKSIADMTSLCPFGYSNVTIANRKSIVAVRADNNGESND